LSGGCTVFIGNSEHDVIVAIVGEGMGRCLTADWGGACGERSRTVVAEVPTVGEGVVDAWIGGCGGKLDWLTFIDLVGFDNLYDRWGDVVDCDVDRLSGDGTVTIDDIQFDWVDTVIGKLIVDGLSDNWCGCTVDVPIVDEGVVSWVGGGGGEGDGLPFVDVGGDIEVGNGGGDVGDGDLDGFGGAGSVVVGDGDGDGDVIITSFEEGVVGVGNSSDGSRTIAEVPSCGVGVFNSWVAVIYAEVEGFTLVEVGCWSGEVDNRGEVIDFDCGGLLGATAVSIGDGEGDIVVTVVDVGMGDVLSVDGVGAVTEVPGVGEVIAGTAVFGCG
jgi:hypothetical protein